MERPAALGADNTPRAYAKPVLVLIDEFSTSAAEHLAALLQDNGRAKLFGKRTVGAGGAVIAVPGGPYAEGRTTLTWTLTNRSKAVSTSDYPEAPYIENIGVRPDIEYEFNTEENLRNQGKPFVEAFLKAAIGLIP
jgi:C-terminal processing protease CtpA/Prc